jgi:hypothetical protein
MEMNILLIIFFFIPFASDLFMTPLPQNQKDPGLMQKLVGEAPSRIQQIGGGGRS